MCKLGPSSAADPEKIHSAKARAMSWKNKNEDVVHVWNRVASDYWQGCTCVKLAILHEQPGLWVL